MQTFFCAPPRFSSKAIDCPCRQNYRPRANRQERRKEQRFDRKVEMIFARKELSSKLEKGSTT
jgi:hypothetical protein